MELYVNLEIFYYLDFKIYFFKIFIKDKFV